MKNIHPIKFNNHIHNYKLKNKSKQNLINNSHNQSNLTISTVKLANHQYKLVNHQ